MASSATLDILACGHARILGVGDGVRTVFPATKGPLWIRDWQSLLVGGVIVDSLLRSASHVNLMPNSENFLVGWGVNDASRTIVADPRGTTTAVLLEEGTNNSTHVIYQSATTTAAMHTISGFGMAGVRSRFLVRESTNGNAVAFNLATGTILSTAGATAVGSISPLWWMPWVYRWSMSWTSTAALTSLNIYILSSAGTGYGDRSYQGIAGANLTLSFIQVEAGPLTPYHPSGTVTDWAASTGGTITLGEVPRAGAMILQQILSDTGVVL